SFIVILLIAMIFTDFKDNPGVERVFKGIRPAVVALIAAPLYQMGKSAGITRKTVIIPTLAALIVWQTGVSPIYIIIAAIAGGIAYGKFIKKK
ncbi:chromate transporter, partial [uncultured Butyricimonas sp.]